MMNRPPNHRLRGPGGRKPNRYSDWREQRRRRVWDGVDAQRFFRQGQVPWQHLPQVVEPRYWQRLDLNWYSFPIENLVWVMTRNYHPRYRVHYQTLDAMLGLEFVFVDADSQTQCPAAWYWYMMRARQVHFRMLMLRWLIEAGYWSNGAYWLILPDRTGYLLNARAVRRWDARLVPSMPDQVFVSVWLAPSQRVVSFMCPHARLGEVQQLFRPLAPNEWRLLDLSRKEDWYGRFNRSLKYGEETRLRSGLQTSSYHGTSAPHAVPSGTVQDRVPSD